MLVRAFSLYLCMQLIKRVSFVCFNEVEISSRCFSVRYISGLVTVIKMVVFIIANDMNELDMMGVRVFSVDIVMCMVMLMLMLMLMLTTVIF